MLWDVEVTPRPARILPALKRVFNRTPAPVVGLLAICLGLFGCIGVGWVVEWSGLLGPNPMGNKAQYGSIALYFVYAFMGLLTIMCLTLLGGILYALCLKIGSVLKGEDCDV